MSKLPESKDNITWNTYHCKSCQIKINYMDSDMDCEQFCPQCKVKNIKEENETFAEMEAEIRMGKTYTKIEHDIIEWPAHYNHGKIQPIDVIEDWRLDFRLASALKYINRAGKKDPTKTKEDLEKAIWYIKRFIDKEL